MPKHGANLLCHPSLIFVPEPGDKFLGTDSEDYRIMWITGYVPRDHCFIVRVARPQRAMGRLVDAGALYAAIRHEGDGTWREIDL